MRWSWRVARIAGIDLEIHGTFWILVGWVALEYLYHGRGFTAALGAVGFILALFAIVVMHELGHALMARRFGIATRNITLLPIGGVAQLERIPEEPLQELAIAVAGPAVNVVLAVLLFALLLVFGGWDGVGLLFAVTGQLLPKLFWVNVAMVTFNLIPAFPMDGGRVLRALLAMKMDYVRATRTAATVGQTLALLLGLFGLTASPMLVFIALFVWLGAAGEATSVETRSELAGVPVAQAMVTDFQVLSPDDPLERAVGLMLSGFQTDFPVVEGGVLVGVLTRDALVAALSREGESLRVADAMTAGPPVVPAEGPLVGALPLLGPGHPSVPVVQDRRLVGLLTPDHLSEFLQIRAARDHRV